MSAVGEGRWSAVHRRLARGTERGGAERCLGALLQAPAWLYGGFVAARGWAYTHRIVPIAKPPVWTLAVGGLTAGGSGKTPLAAHLAQRLASWGYRPLLVARGYRAPDGTRTAQLATRGAGEEPVDWRRVGDEARLLCDLAPGIPVAVARRREEAWGLARRAGLAPQLMVLDGAFQHRRLASNCWIVSLDASRPAGQGWLLPRGDLREPWRALRRADLIVLHRAELCPRPTDWESFLARSAPGVPFAWSENRWGLPRPLHASEEAGGAAAKVEGARSWEALRSQRLGVWTALANPEAFLAGLGSRGIEPTWACLAPDHALPPAGLATQLAGAARDARLAALLVTEKDAVKLASAAPLPLPVLVVPARTVITRGEERLVALLRGRLATAALQPGTEPA